MQSNSRQNPMGPVFIVGLPRSGTKLLREILNRHEYISIPKAETGFIPYFYNRHDTFGDLNQRSNFRKFYTEFQKSSFYYHIDNAAAIWDESKLYKSIQHHDMATTIRAIYRLHADYEGKRAWGDKTPEYLDYMVLIKHLFPDARFVHILRDVRDYCLSTHKAWGKNIYRAAQKWADSIEGARKQTRVMVGDYYEIKYEALVDDAGAHVQQLCRWLGIDYAAGMVELVQQVENLGDNKNKAGILTGNYQKWNGAFRPAQIRRIESIAGRMLTALGYPLDYPSRHQPLSPSERIFFTLSDITRMFQFRIREYGSPRMASARLLRDLKTKTYTKRRGSY